MSIIKDKMDNQILAWKIGQDYYALYTESDEHFEYIKKNYPDIEIMGDYNKNKKPFAKQYKVPIHQYKSLIKELK